MNAIATYVQYLRTLAHFGAGKPLDACPITDRLARAHLYTLVKSLSLWNAKHYRAPSYAADLQANLSNVAVPGTGLPLSVFACNRLMVALLVVAVAPLLCVVGAAVDAWAATAGRRRSFVSVWCAAFRRLLLSPDHWFAFWQLNSRLSALHSAHLARTQQGSRLAQYNYEDKWEFTRAAKDCGLPVGTVLEFPSLVARNKNVEGGMGVLLFDNVLSGGDWIINEKLHNAPCLARLLPPDAPLSTLRVMTASDHWVTHATPSPAAGGAAKPSSTGRPSTAPAAALAAPSQSSSCTPSSGTASLASTDEAAAPSPLASVSALSCVFRAGLSGASTDHTSVLFDVDTATGVIGKATTNGHWYRLGLANAARCPWTSTHAMTHHPDTGAQVTGEVIPDMHEILRLVRRAHATLLPDVPVVGWDVALTTKGLVLLECNLSANFFRGSFDVEAYTAFVDGMCHALEARAHELPQGVERLKVE